MYASDFAELKIVQMTVRAGAQYSIKKTAIYFHRQFAGKTCPGNNMDFEWVGGLQQRLNDRPRAVLNYDKQNEVINKLVALKV